MKRKLENVRVNNYFRSPRTIRCQGKYSFAGPYIILEDTSAEQ